MTFDPSAEQSKNCPQKQQKHGRSGDTKAKFIAYPKALALLKDRLDATREEMAAWVFMGPDEGGLAA
ncbi:hypothetical protein [Nitrosococcus watsonii]|uniref:hypothetical protein n=1 Tax=Nitrosococcus watsonii TaxID=473531 RepID=UPI0002DDEA2E|nr:hypothetical protein [Nitrosococcus watsonii]